MDDIKDSIKKDIEQIRRGSMHQGVLVMSMLVSRAMSKANNFTINFDDLKRLAKEAEQIVDDGREVEFMHTKP